MNSSTSLKTGTFKITVSAENKFVEINGTDTRKRDSISVITILDISDRLREIINKKNKNIDIGCVNLISNIRENESLDIKDGTKDYFCVLVFKDKPHHEIEYEISTRDLKKISSMISEMYNKCTTE